MDECFFGAPCIIKFTYFFPGCIFPFKDSGKTCTGPTCYKTDGDSKAWCSTKVDGNGKHVNGHYKYCYENSGRDLYFPYYYIGK